MKFLLVEDNPDLAMAIALRMRQDGHVLDHAENLADASAFVSTGEYDLILLDIMLPDGDGRTFLEKHRASNLDTPVIILTARSQVSDRIGSLDLGADDYVTKPFDHAELEARCRAVLRRKSGIAKATIEVGDVVFNPVAGHLTVRVPPWRCATENCAFLNCSSVRRVKSFRKANWLTDFFPTTKMPPRTP